IIAMNGEAEDELLRLAAAAEQYSEHPLAKAIVAAAQARGLRLPEPQSFSSEPGVGVSATIDGRAIMVGGSTSLQTVPVVPASGQRATGSIVYVAERGGERQLGMIELRDELKSDSADAVRALHAMGLRTMLLTG